ncbi:MAG: hypothetical protein CL946_06740 [Ectothiorhodospiraceae bacterium]|nr:hypothetical protein [Ectothiorhodospiraceae bacterium]
MSKEQQNHLPYDELDSEILHAAADSLRSDTSPDFHRNVMEQVQHEEKLRSVPFLQRLKGSLPLAFFLILTAVFAAIGLLHSGADPGEHAAYPLDKYIPEIRLPSIHALSFIGDALATIHYPLLGLCCILAVVVFDRFLRKTVTNGR